jgi:hypothetical protein
LAFFLSLNHPQPLLEVRRGEKDGILEVRRNKKTSPPYLKEEGEKDGILE